MNKLFLFLSLFATLGINAQIVNIPDPNLKDALVNYVFSGDPLDANGDGEIQVSEAEGWDQWLLLEGYGISDMTGLEAFINITYLELDSNNLTSVDFSNNLLLENLYLKFNDITSIDISQNVALEHFSINNNHNLEELDVSNNVNLYWLNITWTNITEIDISNNVNLTDLYIHYTPMPEIDLSNQSSLIKFGFIGAQIEQLDLSNCTDLSWLRFESTPNLTELDVSQNEALTTIRMHNTNLSYLDLSNNPNMCFMEVSQNTQLEYVNMQNGNNINYFQSGCPFGSARFELPDNPVLQFICVDDIEWAEQNFTDIPPLTTFVEDCSIMGEINRIKGDLVYDLDLNGCDPADPRFPDLMVISTDGTNEFASISNYQGQYQIAVLEGTYNTSVQLDSQYYTVSPDPHTNTFSGFNQVEYMDFCITPDGVLNDLNVNMVPLEDARPGFETEYQLLWRNIGTTELDGELSLSFDDSRVFLVEASPAPDASTSNTLSWDLGTLAPLQDGLVALTFELLPPPTNESGDLLNFTATINPIAGDFTPDDNVYELVQEIVNSQDPNDKLVLEGEEVYIDDADQYLNYVVRFQNIGTASAINVRIEDELDPLLDWSTLRILNSSHLMQTQISNGMMEFEFWDINLPSVDVDPEGSQGFVAYQVKPISSVALGDAISNTAAIYFDFNAPIITNTVTTTFIENLGVDALNAVGLTVSPNPATDLIRVAANAPIKSIELFRLTGERIQGMEGSAMQWSMELKGLASGLYFLQIELSDGRQGVRRLLVE